MAEIIVSIYEHFAGERTSLENKKNIEHIFAEYYTNEEYDRDYKPVINAMMDKIFVASSDVGITFII